VLGSGLVDGDGVELPAGSYQVNILAAEPYSLEVTIQNGQTTNLELP